jgi:enamine deaminase RidA (YjgF/YER057c/UK114 family)
MEPKKEHINPEGLFKSPAFSQIVTTQGNGMTIYVGGQNAVNEEHEIIGKNDLALQTEQVMKNLIIALRRVAQALTTWLNSTSTLSRARTPEKDLKFLRNIWGRAATSQSSRSYSWPDSSTLIFWWKLMPLHLYRNPDIRGLKNRDQQSESV